GHGHHQTAGLWAPKAVALAADPNAYPEMSQEILASEERPRVYDALRPWNGDGVPVQVLDVERGSEKPQGLVLPIDDVSPLYGKTYRDIGMDAFTNHRTQGVSVFLGSPFFRRPMALLAEGGGQFDAADLAVPLKAWATEAQKRAGARLQSWDAFPASDIDAKLSSAHDAVLNLDWKRATEDLAAAARLLQLAVPQRHDPEFNTPFDVDAVHDVWEMQDRVERALA